jgi:hypothetical protein
MLTLLNLELGQSKLVKKKEKKEKPRSFASTIA